MAARDPDTRKISEEDGFPVRDILTIVPSAVYDDNSDGGAFRKQAYRLLRLIMADNPQIVRDYMKALRAEDGNTARIAIQAEAYEDRLKSYVETKLDAPSLLGGVTAREVDSARVAVHRGDLLLAAGRTSAAADWYNGESAEARAARAILARFSRSTTESSRILDRASREMPEIGLVQYHFSALELQNERDVAAQAAAADRARQMLPLLGRAHAELARLYVLTGKAEQALPLLDAALAREPEFADHFYQIRAETLLALGRHDDAFQAMNHAAALPHSDKEASERYSAAVLGFRRKIESARRDADDQRLQRLRNEVVAEVRQREPLPPPPAPAAPVPEGRINYQIEARVALEVMQVVYPEYPEAMRRAGTTGNVTLAVIVAANGSVASATVVNSALPALNAAVVDAVKRWTFNPAQRAGTTRTLRIVFSFLLQ
jgi:TonB family protein